MNYIIGTLLKYFVSDLPLLLVSSVCLFYVINIFLKEKSRARRWIALILFEATEHLLFPFIAVLSLFIINSYMSGIIFMTIFIIFIFGFIGCFVVKARTFKEWGKVFVVYIFSYFFMFIYPSLLINLQISTNLNGFQIMAATLLLFTGVFVIIKLKQRQKRNI